MNSKEVPVLFVCYKSPLKSIKPLKSNFCILQLRQMLLYHKMIHGTKRQAKEKSINFKEKSF